MRKVLMELRDLLNEQKTLLSGLLELSREEQQIIINNESDKLEAIVRLQLRELSKLGALEKKRAALNKIISSEMNIAEKSINLSAIAQAAQPSERDILRKLQTELTALIDEHKQANLSNRELINSHREYSGAMLELMSEPEDPLNNFYGGDGRSTVDRKKTTGFYNKQA